MTYKNFTLETDADGIALVTWDMPDRSMNVFTEEVMDELEKIVDAVAADAAVKGAVITSGKDSFSGGADLNMLKRMLALFHEEKAKDPDKAIKMLFDGAGRMGWLWRKLETIGKPWVSAINGTCMGGAFELSLACHGRVAADSDKVKMALPEVKVGIFPGAGGTQRVPQARQHAGSAADADHRPDADAAKGQGDGADPRDRRARQAGRDRQGDDQERAEAGRAMGREGFQGARRSGLFGGRRQSVAAGNRHPAPRDLRQLSGRRGHPEMRL